MKAQVLEDKSLDKSREKNFQGRESWRILSLPGTRGGEDRNEYQKAGVLLKKKKN